MTDVNNMFKLFHLSVDESLWNSIPADHCGVFKSPEGFAKKPSARQINQANAGLLSSLICIENESVLKLDGTFSNPCISKYTSGIPFDSCYISLTIINNSHSHMRENDLIIHVVRSGCNQNQIVTLKGEEPKGPYCKHIKHRVKKKESIPSLIAHAFFKKVEAFACK